MVRNDKQALLLDQCHNKIIFPDEGLDASVPMLDALPIEARRRYSGDEVLRTPTDQELTSTSKCLMVEMDHISI